MDAEVPQLGLGIEPADCPVRREDYQLLVGIKSGNSSIQNPYIMRKGDAFYRCNGELGTVAEYLEDLEAIQLPDWNKDPDFPYS